MTCSYIDPSKVSAVYREKDTRLVWILMDCGRRVPVYVQPNEDMPDGGNVEDYIQEIIHRIEVSLSSDDPLIFVG